MSEFTSIYERIQALKQEEPSPSVPLPQAGEGSKEAKSLSIPPLHPFRDATSSPTRSIPFTLKDYLELLDFTGKHITSPSKASIAKKLPSILTRLNIDPTPWAGTMRPSGNLFGRAIGRFDRLRSHAWNLGQDWIHGMNLSKKLFGE